MDNNGCQLLTRKRRTKVGGFVLYEATLVVEKDDYGNYFIEGVDSTGYLVIMQFNKNNHAVQLSTEQQVFEDTILTAHRAVPIAHFVPVTNMNIIVDCDMRGRMCLWFFDTTDPAEAKWTIGYLFPAEEEQLYGQRQRTYTAYRNAELS